MESRRRPSARSILVLLLAGLAAGSAGASPGRSAARVPPLVFPVVGPVSYEDDFGEPRPQGPHEGDDVLASRRALAVAVEGGTVRFWTTSPAGGCLLYLDGDSATTYLYAHLNNDLTAENDNLGECVAGVAYARGLHDGDRVEAGQPVGYVGDSGDADGLHPHLHFEVHPGGGAAVDPFRYLRRARPLLFAAVPGTTSALTLRGSVVSAEPGRLTLAVDLVRAWPSGRKIVHTGLPVTLAVPPDAWLASGSRRLVASLRQVAPGTRAVVLTQAQPTTLEAERGDDGALTAARVALAPARG